MTSDTTFPDYLNSFESLQQHFRAQLEGITTTAKGKRFAQFVQKLVPQTDIGSDFDLPTLSDRVSGDDGVDLTATGKADETQLYVQSKLWVDRAETVDSVISKFQAFSRTGVQEGQASLFGANGRKSFFLLVTLSPLAGILDRYKAKEFASKQFYSQLLQENRIRFIDGHHILQVLQATYRKLNHIPANLSLNFETPYIQLDNVFIGVLSSDHLKALYSEYGDALFFENVRDFLSTRSTGKQGRTSPNNEIIKTIMSNPEKLLPRNNGIVFGAEKVEPGATANQLVLSNASVVNGCQTTMCIVEFGNEPSYVLAKVVQTDDAWDITKSANYQTAVPDIDLELARFLRPQLVKRAATHFGVQVDDFDSSAFQVVDQIYDRKIAYNETRLLYVGLFSRSPNNVFASNYTELVQELIERIYQEPSYEEDIFETLFLLQAASQQGLKESKVTFVHPSYAGMFERLFKDESLPYRCFVSILALCGAVNTNIAERENDIDKEYVRVKAFLSDARSVLKNASDTYSTFYKLAVKLWMQLMLTNDDEAEVRRDMYLRSKQANFTTMFRKICMEADLAASTSSEKVDGNQPKATL